MRVNVAHICQRSEANGPGERFVVWVQGCPLACPGCWNAHTWAFERRQLVEVDELATMILETQGIEGVTFTGGEPFAQARALAHVARAVREAGLSVVIFTGYEQEELTSKAHLDLLDAADMIIMGRYVESLRDLDLVWRGSSNQEVVFMSTRYTARDMDDAPSLEVIIDGDGTIRATGFPPETIVSD